MKTQSKNLLEATQAFRDQSLLSVLLINVISFMLQADLTGQSWNALGPGLNRGVQEIVVHENEVYVGGYFTDAGGDPDADYLAKWDGNAWHAVAPGLNGEVNAIAFSGDDIYVGGSFTTAAGNNNASRIARWDGSNWHALHQGVNNSVQAISISGDKVYVGGFFTNVGGVDSIDHIAVWENNSWHALGPPLDPFNTGVNTIAIKGDDVYVGGDFLNAGEVEHTSRIARWDGHTWNALGTGYWGDMGVIAMAFNENDLYVGGDGGVWDTIGCGILRWDGNTWNPLGVRGLSNCIYGEGAWSVASTGNYTYVGGIFANAGDIPGTAYLAKWDGENWEALGDTGLEWDGFNPNTVYTIATNGDDVYVGGNFPGIGKVTGTQNIARWNDVFVATHHPFEESVWNDLRVHPNPAGDVIDYALAISELGKHTVSIMNGTGGLVYSGISVKPQLDISFLPPGVYFIKVITQGTYATTKVIKL